MTLVHREAGPTDGPVVVCVHGWPENSRMWDATLEACAARGLRALAPDLPGYGASPPRRPATWAMHREALEEWRADQELGRVGLVVHDWGGLIGLRWACDHPDLVSALVISDTGFFGDGKWHGMAKAMRTPGQGEELLAGLDRTALGAVLSAASPGMTEAVIDSYWPPFATDEGKAAQLELYRSGNLEELEPYAGALDALGVPTLLLWGEDDPFAPIAGAHRLAREIRGSELKVLENTGHFAPEDAPEAYAKAASAFLARALLGG